jgi:predicted transcriptional regulator
MKTSKKFDTLIIRFESWEDFKDRTKEALKTRRPSITPANTLVFTSVADYQKFMSEQKLAILAVIIKAKPESIYKLAQLVERDVANVQRDCIALEAMGFIKIGIEKGSKGAKAPHLAFAYTRIEIHMQQVTYSHDLAQAA